MNKRNTTSKNEVLNTLKLHGSAMSHEMIDSQLEHINRATIYRILNSFCDDEIIHRIIDENGKQFFALCDSCDKTNHSHNHLHFKCLKCNTVECLESELNFSLPSNYSVENFNAMISGICGKCS